MYKYIEGDGKISALVDSTSNDIAVNLAKYKEILNKYYLGDIDEEKLAEGSIKGYIEGLDDPYTEYISKEEMKDYMEDTLGNYVGIGIYMTADKKQDKVKVISPIKGSPAEKAGIEPGDIIVSVNGKTYKASEMSAMSNDIKGEEGTEERSCQTADRIRRLQDRRQHCYAHARTFYTSDFTILTANQK